MEQENKNNPKVACIIALICMLAPIIVTLILAGNWVYVLLDDIALGLIMEVSFLALYILGLIIIINVRIQHPQYGFGKVVMGMYIVGIIIIIAIIWKAIAECYSCITGCWDCLN